MPAVLLTEVLLLRTKLPAFRRKTGLYLPVSQQAVPEVCLVLLEHLGKRLMICLIIENSIQAGPVNDGCHDLSDLGGRVIDWLDDVGVSFLVGGQEVARDLLAGARELIGGHYASFLRGSCEIGVRFGLRDLGLPLLTTLTRLGDLLGALLRKLGSDLIHNLEWIRL